MKNGLWIFVLFVAISFTGCYTSFSPRDAESEAYGKLSKGFYDSPDIASAYDSLDFEEYGSVEEYPQNDNDVTVVNNYYGDSWDSPPLYYNDYSFSGGFGFYGAYYDPFYSSYYSPFHTVYYPNYASSYINVYGDAYFGWYSPNYYGGRYFSPSPVRYRTYQVASSYNTGSSLRNTRGRTTLSRRSRNTSGGMVSRTGNYASVNSASRLKGFDLDRDLVVTKRVNNSEKISGSLRNAGITKTDNARSVSKRSTSLSRRRIAGEKGYRILASRSSSRAAKRTYGRTHPQSVKNKKVNKSRSKRTYSSSRSSGSRNSSSRSYYRPPSRSSNRTPSVSGSSRGSRSGRSYSGSRSPSRSSSSSSRSSKKTRRR